MLFASNWLAQDITYTLRGGMDLLSAAPVELSAPGGPKQENMAADREELGKEITLLKTCNACTKRPVFLD